MSSPNYINFKNTNGKIDRVSISELPESIRTSIQTDFIGGDNISEATTKRLRKWYLNYYVEYGKSSDSADDISVTAQVYEALGINKPKENNDPAYQEVSEALGFKK